MTAPATKHARLVVAPMPATRRYATAVGVRWEEGESAHLKSPATAPSRSALSAPTASGSYASSCGDTSTSRGQQGGWTGTGDTHVLGRCSTPRGSPDVVEDEDLAHEQCGGDGPMAPEQREHLRATSGRVVPLTTKAHPVGRIRRALLHLHSQGCRGRGRGRRRKRSLVAMEPWAVRFG